jgi:hypothetical protein
VNPGGGQPSDVVLLCQLAATDRRKAYIRGLDWLAAMDLAREAMDRVQFDPHMLLLALDPDQLAALLRLVRPCAAAELAAIDAADLAAAGVAWIGE